LNSFCFYFFFCTQKRIYTKTEGINTFVTSQPYDLESSKAEMILLFGNQKFQISDFNFIMAFLFVNINDELRVPSGVFL